MSSDASSKLAAMAHVLWRVPDVLADPRIKTVAVLPGGAITGYNVEVAPETSLEKWMTVEHHNFRRITPVPSETPGCARISDDGLIEFLTRPSDAPETPEEAAARGTRARV